jgi:hypothetical protein
MHITIKQVIENIKRTIEEKEIILLYPIAHKLQANHCESVIEWAIECIQIYSSETKVNDSSMIDKYIRQLRDSQIDSQNIFTSALCENISQEVWSLPDREEIQTAISRLWWSIARFKNGDDELGILEASRSVELLVPYISEHQLLDRYLEAALIIYEKYSSQEL